MSCPGNNITLVQKWVSGYGDLFSEPPHRGGPAHHQTTLLVTAPIAATNGIEDRLKERSVLKKETHMPHEPNVSYFWDPTLGSLPSAL